MKMSIFVLIVMMHVNSGGNITFQEFNSLEKCEHAKKSIYSENKRNRGAGLETAFCVAK